MVIIMKKNKIILPILFLCIISLISLSGCSNKEITEQESKEKVIQELDYLDSQIIGILNKLNNITLENYTVTSEEVSLEQSSSSGGESGSSGSSGESGQSSGVQQEEQKQSGGNEQSGNSKEKSNITASQMEPKTILASEQGDIDWNTVKSEIEKINNSWGVILLDLSSFNINSNDVLGFSNALDNCILSIKDENKSSSLVNLANLYSFIPKYEASISAPNNVQNIKQVKLYILNSYAAVEQDNWNEVESNMAQCENTYKNIINDIEYVKDKEIKVNRTYVLIKELQNSLSYKDKKLFYIKYKNLIESINTL